MCDFQHNYIKKKKNIKTKTTWEVCALALCKVIITILIRHYIYTHPKCEDSGFETNVECFIYWCSAAVGDDPGTFMVLHVHVLHDWNVHQRQKMPWHGVCAPQPCAFRATDFSNEYIGYTCARCSAWMGSNECQVMTSFMREYTHGRAKQRIEKSGPSLPMTCVFWRVNGSARTGVVTECLLHFACKWYATAVPNPVCMRIGKWIDTWGVHTYPWVHTNLQANLAHTHAHIFQNEPTLCRTYWIRSDFFFLGLVSEVLD